METAPRHAEEKELAERRPWVLESPTESTTLQSIVLRPEENQRQFVEQAELSPEQGIVGDHWISDQWHRLPDGTPNPMPRSR